MYLRLKHKCTFTQKTGIRKDRDVAGKDKTICIRAKWDQFQTSQYF